MSGVTTAALVAAPLLVGAAVQRTAGLGLVLVAAPFLAVALGARDGVSFGNAMQCVLCATVLARTWPATRWRAAGLLLTGAAVGVPLGALVVSRLAEGPLLVLLGTLALAAVGLSLVPAAGAVLGGSRGAVGAGALAGFVNATAGVGGPMVSAYALAQRWDRSAFVPTAQVVLLVINAGAVVVKGAPTLPAAVWVGGLVALTVGVALGEVASRRVDPRTGRRVVTVVAVLGAAATVVRGLTQL